MPIQMYLDWQQLFVMPGMLCTLLTTPRRLMKFLRGGRRRFILLSVFLLTIGLVTIHYWYRVTNFLSYVSRPLWDAPDGPTQIIPHFYAEDLDVNEDVCRLHGWTERKGREEPELWDAILLNTELDLLEVRLNELDIVVDKFFIIESNRTFTGHPKPLFFTEHRNEERFAKFKHKIVYTAFPEDDQDIFLTEEEENDPWIWERLSRSAMTKLIQTRLPNTRRPPLVVFSDVDEIPSAHSLHLLRICQSPSPIHLQMRNFLYSFEWPYGWGSWRAQVHEWDDQSKYYKHSMSTDVALADSGWHCSFCFRHIDDFADKMQAYSHADRLGGDTSLLSYEHIQDVICKGADIFNMLPEAYSYRDLIQLMYPEPSRTGVHIPKYIIENAQRFKYLLPGGCIRE